MLTDFIVWSDKHSKSYAFTLRLIFVYSYVIALSPSFCAEYVGNLYFILLNHRSLVLSPTSQGYALQLTGLAVVHHGPVGSAQAAVCDPAV